MKYNIAEKFVSINGEGRLAGQLSVFIRFTGCNLNCSYCDTTWANDLKAPFELMDENEIYNYIKSTGVRNVTLTGGEPLIQKNIRVLLEKLASDKNIRVEIETNGSKDISEYFGIDNRPSFTVDYKLEGSGMEQHMFLLNFSRVQAEDTVKFVVSNMTDLINAYNIINRFGLSQNTRVFISPVFGRINPEEIVDFMKEKKLNDINLQLQIHKIIWDPNKKGV